MRKFLLGLIVGLLLMSIPVGFAVRYAYFNDVPSGRWYSDAVNDLASKGFFSGYGDGTFRPERPVNRAELAVILQQMLNYIEENGDLEGATVPFNSYTPQPVQSVQQPQQSQPQQQQTSVNTNNFNAAYGTPYANSFGFVQRALVTQSGAIRSTLGSQQPTSAIIGVNDEILSESYGIYFNALALANERDTFDRAYQFFRQYILSPENLAYWKLNANLTPYQQANAMIDDLRIVKGLLRGYQKFGVTQYRDTALAMAAAIKQYGLRNNVPVSSVTWNANGRFPANYLILGYADLEALDMLRAYDSSWSTVLQNTAAVVKNGQFNNGLFADRYDFSSGTYSTETSHQMIFEAYAAEYLALSGERPSAQKFINFVKNEFAQRGKIFAYYNGDGTPAVSYEDVAVYSIIARTALSLNETTFATSLINKILGLQINNPGTTYHGAFLWSTGEVVYAFSQLNALNTVALFRNSTIQPTVSSSLYTGGGGSSASGSASGSTPSVPIISSNNFVLWHMSDIYYGSQDAQNLAAMVNDMDNLSWNDALIAGDMSGDGSINNLTDMRNVIVGQSSHPLTDFHFLAGNHEYNCSGTTAQGCLDNYKSVINPALRYTFDRGNIHFIVLSTDGYSNRMSDDTMAWVRNEVAVHQDKIIVLATHQMPHVLGSTSPTAQSILDSLGVDVWLFGHAHCKHGDSGCNRHGALGDFYQQAETTFVDAGYIGNMESRYLIFTDGSNQVRILSRYHKNGGNFQTQFEHTVTLRYPFHR